MLTPKHILLVCFLLLSYIGISQDYNYIHYTSKDGLAGNTVYGVAQDKDGYMFFGTENGLSRFDGKEWVTFTVKDGLPDNEVLIIFGDSKGRIWIGAFNKAICYYFNGKVYNNTNDSLLAKLSLKSSPSRIHEIENGDIIISTTEAIINITHFNSIENVFLRPNNEIYKLGDNLFADKNQEDSGSVIYHNDEVLYYNKGKQYESIGKLNYSHSIYNQPILQHHKIIDSLARLNNFSSNTWSINSVDLFSRELTFLNTNNGTWRLSVKGLTHFLPNIKTGHTFEDKEKCLWFTTLGNGVYKALSSSIKFFILPDIKGNTNKEIFTITNTVKTILAGASYGKLLNIENSKKKIFDFQSQIRNSANTRDVNRATSSLQFNNTTLVFGFDSYLLKIENNTTSFNYNVMPVKSIEKSTNNCIVVSTGRGCLNMRIKDLTTTDTLFSQRSTYANYLNHQYYVGTTNGLFVVNEGKQQNYLGNVYPALKRRITCIKNYNNNAYIATADAGIIILNNNKVVAVINDSTGLISNSIKTLHIIGTTLWIGTIKGIAKLDLITNKILAKYTSSDGLPSDIINAIYVDTDSTIWVGSPEGLTSFKEKEIASTSICNLVMQKIIVSNNNLNIDSNNFSLRYQDNNIQFQFVGISFRSGDEITYNYRLKGLSEEWKITKERILDFPSLPYDKKYTLEIYATNKFGVISKIINFSFYVATPFWKTNWFIALVYIIGFAIMFGFIYWRYKKLQARNYERANFKVQLANMEQQALQAQMNPHFIFNCLNSIQQFILFKETEKANKYLILFSRLIRNTLDNSDKKTITLADEKIYLEQYLEMEQMRFGEKFVYTINVESSIDINEIMIPAMLLQPFLENSLRHGIRQLKERNGTIAIEFKQRNDYLYCHIKDDGIGREAAEKLKTNMHIEYQSKGVNLTNKRVELLNTNLKNKISIEMIDCKDEIGVATGTEVIVMIPINLE